MGTGNALSRTRLYLCQYVYYPGYPAGIQQRFLYQRTTAGLTVSLLVLAVAVGSLFYGPLSDRVGRKAVMVGASFLVIIPTLLCGFAPNFTTLVVLRTTQGLLMPGLTSVAIPYVNEEFEGKGRGLAMGIYVSGLTLGGLFARVGSAALTGWFDWRIAMEAFTLPTLIAAIFMWRFLPETNAKKKRPTPTTRSTSTSRSEFLRQTLRDMWLHLHNRRLVGAFIIGFTLFFGFIGTFTYLPYYLTGPHFNLPTIALGLVYLLWLTGIFSPAAGTLALRIGSRKAIAFSMGLAATRTADYAYPHTPRGDIWSWFAGIGHVRHCASSQPLPGRAGHNSQGDGGFYVPLALLLWRQFRGGAPGFCPGMGRVDRRDVALPGHDLDRDHVRCAIM